MNVTTPSPEDQPPSELSDKPTTDKQMVFDYYLSLFEKNGAKHNHKEASAWGGLLLYVAFCGTLISSSFSADALPVAFYSHSGRILLLILLLGLLGWLTWLMHRYLENQLNLKDRASARIAAASFILSEIVTDPSITSHEFLKTTEPPPPMRSHSGAGILPDRFLLREQMYCESEVKTDPAISATRNVVRGLLAATGLITAIILGIKIYPH